MGKKDKTVKVGTKDLYQFLIEGNRYGFTRNNHLMPGAAFDHCLEYLPKMYDVDPEGALRTATQLAEEAIAVLWQDGFMEDKRKFTTTVRSKNGSETIKCDFSPSSDYYCFGRIAIEEGSEVYVTCGDTTSRIAFIYKNEDGKLAIKREDPGFSASSGFAELSRYWVTIYREERGTQGSYVSVPYYSLNDYAGQTLWVMVSGSCYEGHIHVSDYISFIEFCLRFITEHGGTRFPYNHSDYEEYKAGHGIK